MADYRQRLVQSRTGLARARMKPLNTVLHRCPGALGRTRGESMDHMPPPHLTSTYIGMPCLGSARLVFNSLKAPVSLRSLYSSFTSSISTTTRLVPRRAFSIMANSHNDLFDYT